MLLITLVSTWPKDSTTISCGITTSPREWWPLLPTPPSTGITERKSGTTPPMAWVISLRFAHLVKHAELPKEQDFLTSSLPIGRLLLIASESKSPRKFLLRRKRSLPLTKSLRSARLTITAAPPKLQPSGTGTSSLVSTLRRWTSSESRGLLPWTRWWRSRRSAPMSSPISMLNQHLPYLHQLFNQQHLVQHHKNEVIGRCNG